MDAQRSLTSLETLLHSHRFAAFEFVYYDTECAGNLSFDNKKNHAIQLAVSDVNFDVTPTDLPAPLFTDSCLFFPSQLRMKCLG